MCSGGSIFSGFALTDSLRVIGVAAESAACRYHIPAGAYVIAVL